MFITFEGTEGSGKTTQIALLAEHLDQQGFSVLTTREPGGTSVSEEIRTILSDVRHTALDPRAEMLLFSAARAQLVREVIQPGLDAGRVVISDRFYDSTYAYQGYGHGLDMIVLRTVTKFVTQGLTPDITVFIDVDPQEGLRRRYEEGDSDRMDGFALDFHQRVAAGYQALMDAEPQRWVRIDGSQSQQAVHAAILDAINLRL